MSRKLLPTFFSSHKDTVISTALTLMALAVRLKGLRLDSLWFDEVFSLRAARMSPGDIIRLTMGDVHPPLYYLLLHFWTKLFGETVVAVRMLSVVFSALTVLVLYHLALKLFNRRVALFAALFTALSPFQVFFAQETRMYSQLTFFAVSSVFFFVCWVKEGSRLYSALYLLSTVLLLYTHIYAAFIVMAEFLYFVQLRFAARDKFRERVRGWLVLQLIAGMLFLPWALVIFQQAARARSGFWIQKPGLLVPFSTLFEYCGSVWPALLLLPLFAYGIERCHTEGKDSLPGTRALLFTWLTLTIGIPFFISKLASPFYLPKYTIAASLAFYLFAACGLNEVRGAKRRVLLLSLICLCLAVPLGADLSSLKRERWDAAAYNLERDAQAGDLVLFNSTGSYMSFAYYARRLDLNYAVFPYSATDEAQPSDMLLLQRAAAEGFGTIHTPQSETQTEEKLRRLVGERRRVWVATRYGEGFKNDVLKVFKDEFRASPQPALCYNQRRFLFREKYNETAGAIILEQHGQSCSPQVYLLER